MWALDLSSGFFSVLPLSVSHCSVLDWALEFSLRSRKEATFNDLVDNSSFLNRGEVSGEDEEAVELRNRPLFSFFWIFWISCWTLPNRLPERSWSSTLISDQRVIGEFDGCFWKEVRWGGSGLIDYEIDRYLSSFWVLFISRTVALIMDHFPLPSVWPTISISNSCLMDGCKRWVEWGMTECEFDRCSSFEFWFGFWFAESVSLRDRFCNRFCRSFRLPNVAFRNSMEVLDFVGVSPFGSWNLDGSRTHCQATVRNCLIALLWLVSCHPSLGALPGWMVSMCPLGR